MTFREDMRELIDSIRGPIPGELGLRQIRSFVVTREWTGSMVGQGTSTVLIREILCDVYSPKVVEVSSRDIVASGGQFEQGDVSIGPVTPPWLTGGVNSALLNPDPSGSPTEVYVCTVEPEVDGGSINWYTRISTDKSFAHFRRMLVVRKTAAVTDIDMSSYVVPS